MIHGVPTVNQQVLVREGRVGRGRDFFLVTSEGTRNGCGAQGIKRRPAAGSRVLKRSGPRRAVSRVYSSPPFGRKTGQISVPELAPLGRRVNPPERSSRNRSLRCAKAGRIGPAPPGGRVTGGKLPQEHARPALAQNHFVSAPHTPAKPNGPSGRRSPTRVISGCFPATPGTVQPPYGRRAAETDQQRRRSLLAELEG
jgi:hypothetical protein